MSFFPFHFLVNPWQRLFLPKKWLLCLGQVNVKEIWHTMFLEPSSCSASVEALAPHYQITSAAKKKTRGLFIFVL